MTDAGPYRRSTSEPRVGRRRHRPTRSHAWLSSPRDTPCQSQAPTPPAETRPPSPGLRSLAPALPLPLPARESEWGLASARSLVSSLPSARAVPGPIYAEGERPYSRRMRSLLERRQMAAANRWSPGGTSTHAPATPDSPAPSMPGPRVRGPEGSPAVHIVAGPSAAHGRRSRDAPVAAPVLPRMPGAHDTARGAALPSNADAPRPLGPRTSPARQVTLSSLLDDALEVLAASSRVRPGEVGGEPGALGSVPDAVVGATGDREEPLWRDAATSVAGPTDEGVAGWGHHAWSSALRWLGWERGAVTGGPAGEHTVDGVERVGSGVGIRRGGEAKGGCEGANGTRDGAHLDRPLASEVPAVLGSRPFSPVRGGRAGDATPAGNTNPPLQRRLFGGGDWDGAGPVLPLTPRNVTAVWERVPGTVGDAVSDDEPLASVAGGHLSWTSPDVGPVPRDRRLGASDGRGEGQVEGSARARRVGVDLGGEGQEELLRRSLHGILDGLRSGGGHGGVGDRLGVESDAVGVTGSPERTGWPHVAAHVWRMRFVGAQVSLARGCCQSGRVTRRLFTCHCAVVSRHLCRLPVRLCTIRPCAHAGRPPPPSRHRCLEVPPLAGGHCRPARPPGPPLLGLGAHGRAPCFFPPSPGLDGSGGRRGTGAAPRRLRTGPQGPGAPFHGPRRAGTSRSRRAVHPAPGGTAGSRCNNRHSDRRRRRRCDRRRRGLAERVGPARHAALGAACTGGCPRLPPGPHRGASTSGGSGGARGAQRGECGAGCRPVLHWHPGGAGGPNPSVAGGRGAVGGPCGPGPRPGGLESSSVPLEQGAHVAPHAYDDGSGAPKVL